MNPDPQQHPGRDCSPDCAEYGCAGWTGRYDRAELASHGLRVDTRITRALDAQQARREGRLTAEGQRLVAAYLADNERGSHA